MFYDFSWREPYDLISRGKNSCRSHRDGVTSSVFDLLNCLLAVIKSRRKGFDLI